MEGHPETLLVSPMTRINIIIDFSAAGAHKCASGSARSDHADILLFFKKEKNSTEGEAAVESRTPQPASWDSAQSRLRGA